MPSEAIEQYEGQTLTSNQHGAASENMPSHPMRFDYSQSRAAHKHSSKKSSPSPEGSSNNSQLKPADIRAPERTTNSTKSQSDPDPKSSSDSEKKDED